VFTKFIFHQKNTPNRVFGGLLNPYLLGGVFFAPIVLILKIGELENLSNKIEKLSLLHYPKKIKSKKFPILWLKKMTKIFHKNKK
jgi:hypothetical protein